MMEEVGVDRVTAVDWFNFIRDICIFWVTDHSGPIGGMMQREILLKCKLMNQNSCIRSTTGDVLLKATGCLRRLRSQHHQLLYGGVAWQPQGCSDSAASNPAMD